MFWLSFTSTSAPKPRHAGRLGGLASATGRRGLALLLLLQVTGVVSLAVTLYAGTTEICTERCTGDDETDGIPCSPFCATCTCGHGQAPGLPTCLATTRLLALPYRSWLSAATADLPYDSPDSDGIFHPPRA